MADHVKSTAESEVVLAYNVERMNDYCVGGYYPAQVNEIIKNRFVLRRKMGFGSYSTVWLARDKLLRKLCVIKLIKSEQVSTQNGYDEIKVNRYINFYRTENEESKHIMRMLDDFKISGVNGLHSCIIYEPLGFTLAQLIEEQSCIPVEIVKSIAKQLLQGLDYLHYTCEIIHGDIKPLNILVVVSEDYLKNIEEEVILLEKNNCPLPNFMISNIRRRIKNKSSMTPHLNYGFRDLKNVKIKIGDFGGASSMYEAKHKIPTLPYRSPEVILRSGYGTGVDIWSAACTIYELLTGDLLFDLKYSSKWSFEHYHLASIIALNGPLPLRLMLNSRQKHVFFGKDYSLLKFPHIKRVSLTELFQANGVEIQEEELVKLTSFLRVMLYSDITHRASASKCLQHHWFKI